MPPLFQHAADAIANKVGAEPAQSASEPPGAVFEFPTSFAQQRLWFLEQLAPGQPTYNIPAAARITGPLDLAALARTFDEIVRRHESLRTYFASRDEGPVQLIAERVKFNLDITDLERLDVAERDARIAAECSHEARRPFDLQAPPLIRVKLLRLGAEEHILLQTMHHIISDGWSLGVLITETSEIYSSFAADKPSPLPDLRVQYADYAVWLKERMQGSLREQQLTYWKQRLSGAPFGFELPTDRPRSIEQRFRGAVADRALPRKLSSDLKTIAGRESATLFMILLAGFNVLLHYYTRQDDILVGTDSANRTRPEIEPLIGFFVNQLVLRTDLSGDPTFREILKRTRHECLGAFAHQELPFDVLVQSFNPKRDLASTPLFRIKFVLQSAPLRWPDLGHLQIEPLVLNTGTAKFDLLVNVLVNQVGLRVFVEYDCDLYDEVTVTNLLENFEALLAIAVARLQARLSELVESLEGQARARSRLRRAEMKQKNVRRLAELKEKYGPQH